MAMTVMNNPSAMMTLGELNKNISNQGKSAKKLASGMKINSAGDDASAYSISERMRAQLRSLDQDIDNVKNGRALLKVAAGGIDNIVDELRNLKELALNAANDTNTDEDRATIQKEFDQKMANINDIASETNYNGKILLDGRYGHTFTPIQTSTNTQTITNTVENYTLINRGNYTISADGVYMLASNYSGTVTIANGAQNVKIKQQTPGTAVQNTFIVGPSGGNANLWLDGLNILNTADQSAIKFQGSNNVLTMKGNNKIQGTVLPADYVASEYWEQALINVGDGLAIQSNNGGKLDISIEKHWPMDGRVAIGSNVNDNNMNANLLLYTANITANLYTPSANNYNDGDAGAMIGAAAGSILGDVTIYGGILNISTNGAAIGTGYDGKLNDIIINGGAVINASSKGGSAIGSGMYGGKVNDILIDNATIDVKSEDGAAAIGSGIGIVGSTSSVNDIYIGNSTHITALGSTGTVGGAADIGAGSFESTVRDIVIGSSAIIAANKIGVDPNADHPGIQKGTTTYTNLNLNPNIIAPNVTEPDSGTTTTTETVTTTTTTGGWKGKPLVIHHGTKANQALNCYINDMHTDAMGLSNTKVLTRDDAIWALSDDTTNPPRIGAIDAAINYALDEATTIGAYISRLEFTEDNLVTANENTQFSESTIRDADMAKEMTEYTRSNVLAQASQSMLAQANQSASSVLSLLQ